MKNLSTIPHTQNALTQIFNDVPSDKKLYARKDGEWIAVEAEEIEIPEEEKSKVTLVLDKGN